MQLRNRTGGGNGGGNNSQRGGNNSNNNSPSDGNNNDTSPNSDVNNTNTIHHSASSQAVHELITSLQPINTFPQHNNYPHHLQHHFSGGIGLSGWGSHLNDPHHHNQLWSSDLLSLNSPTAYDEIYQQLSAPTPTVNDQQQQMLHHLPYQQHQQHQQQQQQHHRNHDMNLSGFGGNVYSLNPTSNDSDDLLTYPSFTIDGDQPSNSIDGRIGPSAGTSGGGGSGGGDKKKISDAQTYGPRFCEIFNTFCRDTNQTIDTRNHLMSLCVEHLVGFICWARENEDRIRWLSKLLFENDYLRPEVRNGIVMVIIYTFAAIKALHGGDMFTTLQDTEDGLGIANRFSLKIYNDPYGYLSFLKFSISSLIDAGAIPENERLNKPFKKGNSKLLPTNQHEIDCYNQLKTRLVGFFQQGLLNEARAFVQMITTHWQFRGNALRTKRFSSALEIVNQPNRGNIDIAATVYQEKMQLAREGKLIEEPVTTLADIKSMGNSNNATNANSNSGKGKLTKKHSYSEEGGGAEANKRVKYEDEQSITSLLSNTLPSANTNNADAQGGKTGTSILPLSLELIQNPVKGKGGGSSISNNDVDSSNSEAPETPLHPPPLAQQVSRNFTNPPVASLLQQKPFSFKAIRFERIGINEWKIKETIIFDIPRFIDSLIQLQFASSSSASSVAVSSDLHLYLLNEKPLQPFLHEGYLRMNSGGLPTPRLSYPNALSPQSAGGGGASYGMISLEHELKKLLCITTSWQLQELSQFQQFLLAYYQQYTGALSSSLATKSPLTSPTTGTPQGNNKFNAITLHQFWYQLNHAHPETNREENNTASSTTSHQQPGAASIVGCIGYEIAISMTLIIRENKLLGINYDIWCKLYPNDFTHAMEELLYPLQQEQQQQQKQQQQKRKEGDEQPQPSSESNSMKITFGDLLVYFFPQLAVLEKRLNSTAQQMSIQKGRTMVYTLDDIFVKYSPSSSSSSSSVYSGSAGGSGNNITTGGDEPSENADTTSSKINNTSLSGGGGGGLPPRNAVSAYQTIGLFTSPAKKILARLQSGAMIHDFDLELETDN